jgi:cobalamin biosynthesis Mg chelatase CobN
MKTIVAAAVVALLYAVPAVAQVNPTEQGYSGPAGATQQQITSSPAPSGSVSPGTQSSPTPSVSPVAAQKAAPKKSSSSGLPFTGLEVGLVLAAGAGLLGLGFGLRRMARPSESF